MAYIARPQAPLAPVLRRQFEPAALACATETLGAWSLGRELHEGPLATIREARPAADALDAGWPYVVKRLHTHWQDEPRALDMLLREATVGSQIHHSHLVTVVDGNLEEAPYYIVLPRLPGTTLSTCIASAGRIPFAGRIAVPIALWIARQVAEALSALHDQGWLHADVKPENIVVGPEGHATLIDLGFARLIGEPGSAADRWVAGTWNYIAPEMIRSAGGFDGRSDLYSLGATLYEMLAGQPLFAGRNLAELAAAHRQTTPPPLDQLYPELPRQVTELVHQLLAKEPLRRPTSAREVVRSLVALEITTLGDQVAS